ncbi:MAG: DNA primase [Lachnospiraceae bacterium]|nr:DNA primase [Lachnospiraceae bacterium]
MNIFTEVKSAVSAKEAAIFYGVKVGRSGMACCPFHPDKHPSMKPDNRFHCFGCGADGDVINFVERMFGLTPIDAARKLIADFHLNIDTHTTFPPKSAKTNKYNNEQELLRAFRLYKRDALFYLCKYHCLLHKAAKELVPTTPEELENCHPLYEEAIHNIDFINWIIEELEHATIQQQIELINTYKEVITHARKRITEIESIN